MPTVSGFSQAGSGRVLISVPAPVIFRSTNEFRGSGELKVQGLRLID